MVILFNKALTSMTPESQNGFPGAASYIKSYYNPIYYDLLFSDIKN
jgi:hypothetical protein